MLELVGHPTGEAGPSAKSEDGRGQRYAISEVVARTGVPASSIHHYRRRGLIPEPERVASNLFVYDDRHVVALGVIRSLRQRGCGLDEIRTALPELVCGGPRGGATVVRTAKLAQVGGGGPRAKLIDAVIESFASGADSDVHVGNLCTQAGVAKGTFYRHFDSKDAMLLAAGAAVVERAVIGFASESATAESGEHATVLARHMRDGLPVLLQLAKRSVQGSGPTVSAAADLFEGMAERLGRVVGEEQDPHRAGGVLIVFAVVEIFSALLESEARAGP